jgi:hypothetical protein
MPPTINVPLARRRASSGLQLLPQDLAQDCRHWRPFRGSSAPGLGDRLAKGSVDHRLLADARSPRDRAEAPPEAVDQQAGRALPGEPQGTGS